jgi:hypothetical protein
MVECGSLMSLLWRSICPWDGDEGEVVNITKLYPNANELPTLIL